jgi:pimeloyl-ACP methyl ester carboxylesterase
VAGSKPRYGVFDNGMAYATWGGGPRTLLSIPAGPGNNPPGRLQLRQARPVMRPLVEAGFRVWIVTRRRNMPAGHTAADMADDYAALIHEEFGGRVDVVHGVSYGGMIAQYLAAAYPEQMGRVVLQAAAYRGADRFTEVDLRWATAVQAGRRADAARAIAEYMVPADRHRWAIPLLSVVTLPIAVRQRHPGLGQDMLVEAQAALAMDSHDLLPRVRVPVLLVAGDRDACFPPELVEQTARLIPDSTLVWYTGQGHARAVHNRRVGRDILAFLQARGDCDAAPNGY